MSTKGLLIDFCENRFKITQTLQKYYNRYPATAVRNLI